MSYQTMDHAGWMESNLDASRRLGRKLKNAPEKLNDFQIKVVDILGMVGNGIYNAPIDSEKIEWKCGFDGVSVVWNRTDMATWDFDQLTRLVFLCHEARIRCSIGPAGPRALRLKFHPRKAEGDMAVRHPNLDEAVASFRNYLPANHRIIFKAPEKQPEGEINEPNPNS
jgi:hypothetical protein